MPVTAYCLALFLAACEDEPAQLFEPAISSITVQNALHREQATVDVVLSNPGGANLRVKDVTMAFRPAGDASGAFLPGEEIALEASGTAYSGQLPPLSIGNYDLRVTAVFGPRPDVDDPAPMGPDTIKMATQGFSVAPGGAACFTFATPEEVGQWTHGGFIDNSSGEQTCEGGVVFTAAGGGSASVPVSSACVDPEGEDFYRFDLVSPDISTSADWQPANMSGVFVSAAAVPASRIQAIVGTDADRTFATVDDAGEFAFAEIDAGAAFQQVELAFGELPADEVARQVRIRVFGDVQAGRNVAEGFFHLGALCALP